MPGTTAPKTPTAMGDVPGIDLDVASALSIGARNRQEDALVASFPQGSDGGFAVLSDGMGGHAAGDLASRIIVTEFFAELTLHSLGAGFDSSHVPDLLFDAAEAANDCLRNNIDAKAARAGMGGTVVAVVVRDGLLHWLSVGDSPLYLFRDGGLTRLNEDHSMAPQIDRMVDEGLMDAQTARRHPQRNCLTSALVGEEVAAIDCPKKPLALRHGDLVLVASDGLQFLPDDRIAAILGRTRNRGSREVVAALMSGISGLADPEQDNTSVVVIRATERQTARNTRTVRAAPAPMLRAAARVLSPVRHLMTRL